MTMDDKVLTWVLWFKKVQALEISSLSQVTLRFWDWRIALNIWSKKVHDNYYQCLKLPFDFGIGESP